MTVSRVIRGDSAVRPQTRLRVLEAMRHSGYVPSPSARAMRSKDPLRSTQSLCCALIFGPEALVAESFFNAIAISAENEAARHGLCLLQSHFANDEQTSWTRMQMLLSIEGLCGGILAGSFSSEQIQAFKKHMKHIVLVDAPSPQDASVPGIESDNFSGARLAYQHFLNRGCRRLLVLPGPCRTHYFSQALHAAAKLFVEDFENIDFVDSDFTAEGGRRLALEKFRNEIPYDGVFSSDEVMVGVISGLRTLGVSLPEQVKLIGFDDIPHAAYLHPALTTVRMDKTRLGGEAVRELISAVRGQASANGLKKIVPAELIIRESA